MLMVDIAKSSCYNEINQCDGSPKNSFTIFTFAKQIKIEGEIYMITYTEEMIEQDNLVNTNKEDHVVMERLHKSIVDQAIKEGFPGFAEVINYDSDGFTETEVFASEADRNEERETGNGLQTGVYTSCNGLIRALTIDEDEARLRIAVKSAMEDFSPQQIIYIMEDGCDEEKSGWGNGAELLNKASIEDVKRVLGRLERLGVRHVEKEY